MATVKIPEPGHSRSITGINQLIVLSVAVGHIDGGNHARPENGTVLHLRECQRKMERSQANTVSGTPDRFI